MDIDLLKSTPDDQIQMMLMNMHMAKPAATSPEMGGPPYVDTAMLSFSGGAGGGGPYTLPNSPPTILNPQPTHNNNISFSCNNNNNNNNISFSPSYKNNENGVPVPSGSSQKQTSMAAMREMIFRIAAMQPIYIDPEAVKPPKRRNVRISKDPQSVAARHRRERISERIRILQRLVPGGTKMDTASMLDEAIHYVKFLKNQVQSLERTAVNNHHTAVAPPVTGCVGFPMSTGAYFPVSSGRGNDNYGVAAHHNVQQFSDA